FFFVRRPSPPRIHTPAATVPANDRGTRRHRMSRSTGLLLMALLALAAAGCRQGGPAPAPGGGQAGEGAAAAGGAAAEAPVALEDVMERDPRYLVGISYPPRAAAWPGLARLLKGYAEAARA